MDWLKELMSSWSDSPAASFMTGADEAVGYAPQVAGSPAWDWLTPSASSENPLAALLQFGGVSGQPSQEGAFIDQYAEVPWSTGPAAADQTFSYPAEPQGFFDGLNSTLQGAEDWMSGHKNVLSAGMGGLGFVDSYMKNKERSKYNSEIEKRRAAQEAAMMAKLAKANIPLSQAMAQLPAGRTRNAVPAVGRKDAYREPAYFANNRAKIYAAEGGLASYVKGGTSGQADKIPAMLSDGEFVMDSDVVSALGDGNNEAGAAKLDQMRQNIRKHKRSAPVNKIPPKAKAPLAYLKGKKK